MNPKFSKHALSTKETAPSPRNHAKANTAAAALSAMKTEVPFSFRIPAEDMARFKAACAMDGETMATVIRRYIAGHKPNRVVK